MARPMRQEAARPAGYYCAWLLAKGYYAAWLLIAGFLALGLVVQTDRLGECWAEMGVPK